VEVALVETIDEVAAECPQIADVAAHTDAVVEAVAAAQPPGRSIVMRRLFKAIVLSATTALVCAPSVARADGFVNPWAGVNFGSNISNSRGGFGVNAGGMGAGAVGGEVAFGYNPSFFGTSGDFGNNTELDLMANLLLGIPIGGTHGAGFRPYATGGLGLIRQQIDGGTLFKVSSAGNDWGWNLGLGAMGFSRFNERVHATSRHSLASVPTPFATRARYTPMPPASRAV
jgi:hypothetical protein